MIKNVFYFILKALFVLKIFTFYIDFLIMWLENRVKFKIYDVTTWLKNNCKTHITQYLTKQRQPDNEIWSGIEYNYISFFLQKPCRK